MDMYDPKPKLQAIAGNIKKEREACDKFSTALSLSVAIGKQPGYISQIENGTILPPIDVLMSISVALEVPIARIVGSEEDGRGEYQISRRVVDSAKREEGLLEVGRAGKIFDSETKIKYFALNNKVEHTSLQAMVVKVKAGAPTPKFFHEGQEALWVLEGKLKYSRLRNPETAQHGEDDEWFDQFMSASDRSAELVWFEGHLPHMISPVSEESIALFITYASGGRSSVYEDPQADEQLMRADYRNIEYSNNMNKFNLLNGIGLRLRDMRMSRELSFATLAELSQTNKSYLTKIERCEVAPSLKQLATLANVFDVSLSRFFPSCIELSFMGWRKPGGEGMQDRNVDLSPDSIVVSSVDEVLPPNDACNFNGLSVFEVSVGSNSNAENKFEKSDFDYMIYVKDGVLSFSHPGSEEGNVELLFPGDVIFVSRRFECLIESVRGESKAVVAFAVPQWNV